MVVPCSEVAMSDAEKESEARCKAMLNKLISMVKEQTVEMEALAVRLKATVQPLGATVHASSPSVTALTATCAATEDHAVATATPRAEAALAPKLPTRCSTNCSDDDTASQTFTVLPDAASGPPPTTTEAWLKASARPMRVRQKHALSQSVGKPMQQIDMTNLYVCCSDFSYVVLLNYVQWQHFPGPSLTNVDHLSINEESSLMTQHISHEPAVDREACPELLADATTTDGSILDKSISCLPRTTSRQYRQLEDGGFHMVHKLLQHFPRTYADLQNPQGLIEDGQYIMLFGTVVFSRGIRIKYTLSFLEVVVGCSIIETESSSSVKSFNSKAEQKKMIHLHLKKFFSGTRFSSQSFLNCISSKYREGDPVYVSGKGDVGCGKTAVAFLACMEDLKAFQQWGTRSNLLWLHESFHVPNEVKRHWGHHIDEGASLEAEWNAKFAEYAKKYHQDATELHSIILGELSTGWDNALPTYTPESPADATRNLSQQCLNVLAKVIPGFLGGSANLATSNMTLLKMFVDFQKDTPEERNIRFGVREHGMGAISNGIALHSPGIIPYCATFFVFTDYMRAAIHLSALCGSGVIFVMTNDSIGLGEDGPTHQPVEQLFSLRAMPNKLMLRPADSNETSGAYKIAVLNRFIVVTKDDSSPEAWDYSAWVRNYALFLEERLESFRVLQYDVETDPLRTQDLDTTGLLDELPALQQLLFRLLGCQPQGSSSYNIIIQHALSMVALGSVRIHTAINDAILNLVDKFFEMQRDGAIRALDIYKRAISQAERLSEFYEVCKTIHIGRGERWLRIEQSPVSFLQAMEEYVRDAPLASTNQRNQVVPVIEYRRKPKDEEASTSPPAEAVSAPVVIFSCSAPVHDKHLQVLWDPGGIEFICRI